MSLPPTQDAQPKTIEYKVKKITLKKFCLKLPYKWLENLTFSSDMPLRVTLGEKMLYINRHPNYMYT